MQHRTRIHLAILLACTAGAPVSAEPEVARVALLPFVGDVPTSQLRLLDAAVRNEAGRQGYAVLPDEERRVHIEGARSLGLGCAEERDPSCLYYLAEVAEVQRVLIGEAAAGTARLVAYEVEGSAMVPRGEAQAALPLPGEPLVPVARQLVKAVLPATPQATQTDAVIEAPVAEPPSAGGTSLFLPAVGTASVGVALLGASAVSLGIGYAASVSPLATAVPDLEQAAQERYTLIQTTTWLGVGLGAVGAVALVGGASLLLYDNLAAE